MRKGKTKEDYGVLGITECTRCGRTLRNPSELCWKCNQAWNVFMQKHPLTNYEDLKEEEKRWKLFIEQNPSRRN